MPALALVLVCALVAPASAETPKRPKAPAGKKEDKVAETPTTPAATPAPTPTPTPPAKRGGAEPPVVKGKNGNKEQTFVLGGDAYSGKNRSPQLLYFLERANEELERASLEKRSFIPHLVRTLEEEAL